MIASVLEAASRSWWFRRRLPRELRDKTLSFRMLAATLGRTPNEREESLTNQISRAMEKDRARN